MDFSNQDIIRLYGTRLYLVPDIEADIVEEEVAQIEPSPPDYSLLEKGPKVVWKLKPQAQLAFVLPEAEFGNRALTKILRDAVDAAGFDLSKIGFGVLPGSGEGWDFADMPVDLALVCQDFGQGWKSPIQWQGKRLYFSPSLTHVQQATDHKTALNQALKAVQAFLQA
ncbi:MAG: hypothetical protein AAF587_30310 [Bacteroidota bacterium]